MSEKKRKRSIKLENVNWKCNKRDPVNKNDEAKQSCFGQRRIKAEIEKDPFFLLEKKGAIKRSKKKTLRNRGPWRLREVRSISSKT